VKLISIIFAAAVIASPALAATRESFATEMGTRAGRYERARFLCLAYGAPMPEMKDFNPGLWSIFVKEANEHPDFFKLGLQRGMSEAELKLQKPTVDACMGYVKLITPPPKN
jgi:hypothetical protein